MATKNSKPKSKTGQAKRLETLEAKTEKLKLDFLDNLSKSSIIQLACERTGVGRSTFYDWKNKDPEFAKAVELAMKLGTSIINDLAESQLIRAIQNTNMTAIIFWLKNHHGNYNETIHHEHELVEQKELTPEEQMKIAVALYNTGIITKAHRNSEIIRCGGIPPDDVDDRIMEDVVDQIVRGQMEKLKNPPPPRIETL